MNIGLFGGTFDPIHRGHLALARAARERCQLSRILFVPANVPPHKQSQPLVGLPPSLRHDCLGHRAGEETSRLRCWKRRKTSTQSAAKGKEKTRRRNRTTRSTRSSASSNRSRKRTGSFLLIGIDAFADIAKWHQAEALFRECEFVVASRPGYSLADVANALPASLRPRQEVTRPFHKQAATGDLVLKGVTIHLLDEVYQPISSTAIRQAAAAGKPLGRFVDPAVADYIKKMGLYKGR